MNTLENVALLLLVALLPFQDTILQRTPLRNLGASLSIVPLALLVTLKLARRLGSLDLSFERKPVYAVLYASTITIVYLVIFGTSFQGSSLILKSLNLFGIVALYLFGTFGTRYTPSRWLWWGAMAGFFLTLLAVVAGPALDGNSLLHATANLDARPRGFCTESSTFSVQAVISGLAAASLARRRLSKALLLASTAALLVVSGSKGGLAALLLCVAVYGIARAGLSLPRLIVGAAVLVPVGFFVAARISEGFDNDLISNGSSVATRATMTLFALECAAHNPLGVGFSGFHPAMARYLPNAIQSANDVFSFPLIFTEVSSYRYSMENADCKTWFLDLLVYFGVPFAVAFFVFFVRLLRRLHREGQQILLIGALFSATALLTYYSSMNAYSVPVLLGFCLSAIRHENNPLRQCP